MPTPHQTLPNSSSPIRTSVEGEVLGFPSQDDSRSPLDELIRQGAQKMLQAAINAEVQLSLDRHSERLDEQGRRLVVRNGHLPAREVLSGAGPLQVQQPRVRDNSPDKEQRVQFSPSVLPSYLRKSPAIEELIPWLYLESISTGDFSEALQALVGEQTRGFSPT